MTELIEQQSKTLDDAICLIKKMQAEIVRLEVNANNLQVHADYCESKAIGYEAECKDLNKEIRRLKAEIEELKKEYDITATSESALWGANEYKQAEIIRLKTENEALKDTNKALSHDVYNAEMNLDTMTRMYKEIESTTSGTARYLKGESK